MSFGFSVYNSSGTLLVSSDTVNLHYVGQASVVDIIADIEHATTYEINAPSATGPLMPFIHFPGGTHVAAIKDLRLYSGTTWRFSVYGRLASNGAIWQPNVYCFGRLGSNVPLVSHGIQVFNAAGQAVFDSTRAPMGLAGRMAFSGYAAMNGNTQTVVALPNGITTLGIFGYGKSRRQSYTPISYFGLLREYDGAFTLSGSNLVRSQDMKTHESFEDIGPVGFNRSTGYAETVLVVDLARYI